MTTAAHARGFTIAFPDYNFPIFRIDHNAYIVLVFFVWRFHVAFDAIIFVASLQTHVHIA